MQRQDTKEKVFDRVFITRLIIEVVLIGILVGGTGKYFDSILNPVTATETLRLETILNTKKETYFQAIELMNRALANTDFTINDKLMDTVNRVRGGKYPSEIEVNNCFAKLCIYSSNKEIPLAFQQFFVTTNASRPVLDMVTFVNLIRGDLGNGESIIDTIGDRYKFISIKRPN